MLPLMRMGTNVTQTRAELTKRHYNITNVERAFGLVNSVSTTCPCVYPAEVTKCFQRFFLRNSRSIFKCYLRTVFYFRLTLCS